MSSDPIAYWRVYDKCNGRCYICELPIGKTAVHPSPLSLTFDHVVPLALRGEHSESNLRAAHLFCNVVKSDRLKVSDDLKARCRIQVEKLMASERPEWNLVDIKALFVGHSPSGRQYGPDGLSVEPAGAKSLKSQP